jgi:glycosyltransferase involved in cell wall biosynthesis
MQILVITNLFPNKIEPERATYNRQQISILSKLCSLKVVAPISWFPFKGLFEKGLASSQIPKKEIINGVETFHPRYLMIPKIGRSFYGIFFFLSILLPVLHIYNTFKFDIIFSTWAYPDSFAAVLLSKLLRKPIITKVHGTDINEYIQYWLRRKMISFTLNNSGKVISVSKALRNKMIEIGVEPGKIKVIYNGVDSGIFKPLDKIKTRKALGIDINKKLILFVGNLKPVKGLKYLIKAFAGTATDISKNINLIIIGQGELKKELEDETKKYGIQNCVYFLGGKMHYEISKWMNACDLLCLPSLNEGVPNVILEALACGMPVVASNVGGIPEVITSKDYGMLVKPKDYKELQKILQECLEKSWNREVINRYSFRFSWYHNAEMLFQEMRNICIGK